MENATKNNIPIRDEDNNLLSVTSSDLNYTDISQFVEIDNKDFTYNINVDSIDSEFKEFIIAEKTIAEKISDMFNLYEEVKNNINIQNAEQSHMYLFDSSKIYIGKQNLIPVDRDEYSKLTVQVENLKTQLNACNETKNAENLVRDKKLTALYSTFNSIKNGAVNIIDSTLLPVVEDNLQLQYALNSLKSIISQPITYLVENKNELTVEKRSFKDQRYDITYNYLSNPNYFNDIFRNLLNNPDLSRYQSEIASLKARISELESLLDSGGGSSGGSGTSGGGDTSNIKNAYNTVWDNMYNITVKPMEIKLENWKTNIPDNTSYYSARQLITDATNFLDSSIKEDPTSSFNDGYRMLLILSRKYITNMSGALSSVYASKNGTKDQYNNAIATAISYNHGENIGFKKQLELMGKIP